MASEGITFSVKGIEELKDFLMDTAPNAIQDAITSQLESTAEEIEQTTTDLCPVDTGALQASIDISVNDFTINCEAGEDYASYVDDGTIYMDAQPFFENPINDIISDLAEQIDEEIASSLENT